MSDISAVPQGAAERRREVITADSIDATICTMAGTALAPHDYRPHTYKRWDKAHTSWRCVWCHVVACGNYDEADPCMEPYHHTTPHRSRSGVTWPIGGSRV